MLIINVPGSEFYDDTSEEFVTVGEAQLELEHSLVSLSKWESIWEKPFLGKGDKTTEEVLAYIQCMCLTPNIPPEVFARLSKDNLETINTYINAKMTATWFREATSSAPSREIITAELIYYWMVTLTIPFECETWHLERLFTLIKVCSLKNSPKKGTARHGEAQRRTQLNEERKAMYKSAG